MTLALCAEIVLMTGTAKSADAARERVETALTSGRAAEQFGRMVAALGGPVDFVPAMERHLVAAPIVRDVFADGQGVVTAIDTRGVGMAVVALGGGRATPTDSIDHRVGFDRLAGSVPGSMPDAPCPHPRRRRDECRRRRGAPQGRLCPRRDGAVKRARRRPHPAHGVNPCPAP